MDTTTETLDKLYLEYSNLTEARTAREVELDKALTEMSEDFVAAKAQIQRLKLDANIASDLQKEIELRDQEIHSLRILLEEVNKPEDTGTEQVVRELAARCGVVVPRSDEVSLRREIAELTNHRKVLMQSNKDLSDTVARQFIAIQELRDQAENNRGNTP